MKLLKKATIWTFLIGAMVFFIVGTFNSPIYNKSAFLQNKFAIKFAKRLDEVNGEVTFGRMAASLGHSTKWKSLSAKSTKSILKDLSNLKKNRTKKKVTKKIEKKKVVTPKIAEPVVQDDLELTLSGGRFNKMAMDDKSKFSGSARIANGVIEGISISLPSGDSIAINTSNDRMNGNVFTYQDTATGTDKSGLLYKVSQGVYMVTLTNDSQYPGLRLEFKTDNQIEQTIANKTKWGLDKNNSVAKTKQDAEKRTQDLNAYNDDNYEEDNYDNEFDNQENDIDQARNEIEEQEPAYGFKFNS
jgi:hypothetical protein